MRCELIESLMMLSMVVMAGGGMVGARRVARERVAEASGAMGPVGSHNGRIGDFLLNRVGLGESADRHRWSVRRVEWTCSGHRRRRQSLRQMDLIIIFHLLPDGILSGE